MVRKIIGGLCLFLALAGIVGASTISDSEKPYSLIIAAFFLIIGLCLLLKKGKPKEEKQAIKARVEEQKELLQRLISCKHMVGLPLSEGCVCGIKFEESGISIEGSGNIFNLIYNKITDMTVKTDVEIQKHYVSSIGGAVGGAVLFGPLGAIVGGRAKEKKTRTMEYYFIITYNKNGKIEYISFELIDINDKLKVEKNIRQYKSKMTGERVTVEL